jgi:toxin ParE1/3/4
MAEYLLTNKAVDDLADIWNYTFDEWSEQQADKYYEALISRCEDIARNPTLGKNYDVITPRLYGLHANKHIIFYRRLSESQIEITRILHERMDLKRRILE